MVSGLHGDSLVWVITYQMGFHEEGEDGRLSILRGSLSGLRMMIVAGSITDLALFPVSPQYSPAIHDQPHAIEGEPSVVKDLVKCVSLLTDLIALSI